MVSPNPQDQKGPTRTRYPRTSEVKSSSSEFPDQALLDRLERTTIHDANENVRETAKGKKKSRGHSGTARGAPSMSSVNSQPSHGHGAPQQMPIRNFHEQSHEQPRIPPIPTPTPTQAYNKRSAGALERLSTPQPLLIITDLNGTLLYRPSRANNPRRFVPRPGLNEFLAYLREQHSMMVWSSAQPQNVSSMVDELLATAFPAEDTADGRRARLLAVWDRTRFGLSPAQYDNKTQVYKRLTWVWADPSIQSQYPGRKFDEKRPMSWGQHNTLLLDDSPLKAAAEPHNLVEIPEFSNLPEQRDEDVLAQVARYLDEAKWYKDVSAFIKANPFKEGVWTAARADREKTAAVNEQTGSTSPVIAKTAEEEQQEKKRAKNARRNRERKQKKAKAAKEAKAKEIDVDDQLSEGGVKV
jgi:hypothetical protein